MRGRRLYRADRQALARRNVVLVCEATVVEDVRVALEPILGVGFEQPLYAEAGDTPAYYWTGHRITPGGTTSIRGALARVGIAVNRIDSPGVAIYVGVFQRGDVLRDVSKKSAVVYVLPESMR